MQRVKVQLLRGLLHGLQPIVRVMQRVKVQLLFGLRVIQLLLHGLQHTVRVRVQVKPQVKVQRPLIQPHGLRVILLRLLGVQIM
jgi:hypothetical protein